MAEVGEGGRAAAALLGSRREEATTSCCGHQKREEEEGKGEVDKRETTDVAEVTMELESVTGGEIAEDQGTGGRQGGPDHVRVWQEGQQVQIQPVGGAGWQYQGKECPVRERREVGQGCARDRRQRVGWEGVLGVQMQKMGYEEVPEGMDKGEWNKRQERGVDLWVTGGGDGALQLQQREDPGAGSGAQRAVQLQ